LLRALAKAGRRTGAGDVQVVYSDDHVRRLHALNAPEGMLDRTPEWLETAVGSMEAAAAISMLGDADPDLFHGVDHSRAARAEPRRMKEVINELIGRRAFA
jgi:leucyl aminopeptidase (aminopeptidase T)